jgi:hypothetical protein
MLLLTAFSAARAVFQTNWITLPGSLSMIENCNNVVCGVTRGDEIYCANNKYLPYTADWYKVQGSLHSLDCRGRIYGANNAGAIFVSANTAASTTFRNIPGTFKQVSFDGTSVCGTNSANAIYCSRTSVYSKTPFFYVDGSLTHVTVNGMKLYGVNAAGEIWYKPNWYTAGWNQLPGNLKQIDFDGTTLCGVNANNDVWCATKYLTTNPNWEQVPAPKLSYISVKGKILTGTGPDGQVYSTSFSQPTSNAANTIPINDNCAVDQVSVNGQCVDIPNVCPEGYTLMGFSNYNKAQCTLLMDADDEPGPAALVHFLIDTVKSLIKLAKMLSPDNVYPDPENCSYACWA